MSVARSLSQLDAAEYQHRIKHDGLTIQIGPFRVRLKSRIPQVIAAVETLYADYPIISNQEFSDFHVRLFQPRGIRRWYRPQALFGFDGKVPFKPLPYSQSFPFFEWGLNWCVSRHISNSLIIHSAVVEKNGKAVIMPGTPGAGKSTLCSSLILRGWRLLTDELGMVSVDDGLLSPVPRPVSLKNESIDIISRYAPEAVIGPRCEDTSKGTVAHLRPPKDSILRAKERVEAGFIVLPRYVAGSAAELVPITRPQAALKIAGNTFNYSRLGVEGFETVARLVDNCECYTFQYSQLDDAIETFTELFADVKGAE